MAINAKVSLLAQIDPEGKIAAEEARLGRARSMEASSMAEYRAALAVAAERLGLKNFDGYGIDPDTGILTKAELA